ncbi:MAG: hypothetical protein KGH71_03810 [Candidatus Micrarchaeota archaeon]|nr:hypothetical protein [Candidatus Micrarchaeota archaeon]
MTLHNNIVTAIILLKGRIRLHGGKLNLEYRGRSLKFLYNEWVAYPLEEIFIKEEYAALKVDGKRVVDIGASIGDTAVYFAVNGAEGVVGYEPDPVRYQEAVKNIEINELGERIKLINGVYVANDADKDALFKIDCEGCEYALLPVLKTVRPSEIILEFHKGSEEIVSSLSEYYKVNSLKNYRADMGMLHLVRISQPERSVN